MLEKNYYQIQLGNRLTQWPYNLIFNIRIRPVTIALTQTFYKTIYAFFFGQKHEGKKEDPGFSPLQYYENIKLELPKVCVCFKSDSKLKSMHNLVVNFQPYVREGRLYSKKELFDSLAIHMIKEIGGQFFSIVGQKVFGC